MEQSQSRIIPRIAIALSTVLLATVMLVCIPQGQALAAPSADSGVQVGVIASGDQDVALPAASETPAKQAGAKSSYALLEKNGCVYPCNKKGKRLSKVWKGGSTFKYLLVAANAKKVPATFSYKYVGVGGVKMKLKSVTFLLKGGKSSCTTIAASNPLAGVKSLTTIKNFNKTKVTSIGELAFAETGIKSIALPKTLKKIGKNAFRSDKKLTKVAGLEKTKVTAIPDYAFAESALKSIAFPKGLKKIGENAFRLTKLSGTLKLGGTKVTNIGADAFAETKISAVAFPTCIQVIGQEAFAGNANLKAVANLANSQLRTIGAYAFYGTGVSVSNVPATCTGIGYYAFPDM